MNDLQKDFNSGKEVTYIKNGSSGYQKYLMTVSSVQVIKGKSNDNPLVQACDKDTDIIEFTIKGSEVGNSQKKVEFKEYQALKKDEDGNYKSYAFERFKGNDGTIVPGTLCNDILHLAYDYDDTQRHDREDLPFSQKKFVGLKFEGEAKLLNNKDIIFLTDRRRLKDEEYREGKRKEEETFKSQSGEFKGVDEQLDQAEEELPFA